MSTIQFERRKKKKIFLFPLLVLVLLYISIPLILINKGSKLMEKAKVKIQQKEILAPTTEFYNGMTFLNTASAFPGFSFWSDNIIKSSVKNISTYKDEKIKLLILNDLNNERLTLENIKLSEKNQFIEIMSADSSTVKIELPDSLQTKIKNTRNKFFQLTMKN